MMAIVALVPVVEKLADVRNPLLFVPFPVMELVAVMEPVVVKAAEILIPLPPVVALLPPVHVENTTAPDPVKA